MSKRLDQEREKELQPKRMQFAKEQLVSLDLEILLETDTRIDFIFKGEKIQFFPYSGWHTGKGIKAGRGWENLKKQLHNS